MQSRRTLPQYRFELSMTVAVMAMVSQSQYCLTTEPPVLNNLYAVLICFRCHAFAFATDIKKAFLHVKLYPDDRNFTMDIFIREFHR